MHENDPELVYDAVDPLQIPYYGLRVDKKSKTDALFFRNMSALVLMYPRYPGFTVHTTVFCSFDIFEGST